MKLYEEKLFELSPINFTRLDKYRKAQKTAMNLTNKLIEKENQKLKETLSNMKKNGTLTPQKGKEVMDASKNTIVNIKKRMQGYIDKIESSFHNRPTGTLYGKAA